MKTTGVKRVKPDHFLEISCDYLDPNLINDDFLKSDSTSLTVFQNNIRSLNKNFHLVEEIFNNCTDLPDVLAFCETRLNENSIAPSLEGYSFECENSPTACGGVGIFVSDSLNYTVRNDLKINVNACEDLWIEIETESKSDDNPDVKQEKLVIGTIYRHPGSQYSLFCDRLCASIENLNRTKTKYLLVGDTNVDILKFNLASNVTSYINSLNSVGCNFHIDKPTRITSSSSTCIDHVYSNIKTELLDNHIILSDVSDHFGIITKLCGNTKWEREYPQSYRKTNLSEHEWGNFNRELKINLLDKFSEISCIDNTSILRPNL